MPEDDRTIVTFSADAGVESLQLVDWTVGRLGLHETRLRIIHSTGTYSVASHGLPVIRPLWVTHETASEKSPPLCTTVATFSWANAGGRPQHGAYLVHQYTITIHRTSIGKTKGGRMEGGHIPSAGVDPDQASGKYSKSYENITTVQTKTEKRRLQQMVTDKYLPSSDPGYEAVHSAPCPLPRPRDPPPFLGGGMMPLPPVNPPLPPNALRLTLRPAPPLGPRPRGPPRPR